MPQQQLQRSLNESGHIVLEGTLLTHGGTVLITLLAVTNAAVIREK
jgi:hypothetical protein